MTNEKFEMRNGKFVFPTAPASCQPPPTSALCLLACGGASRWHYSKRDLRSPVARPAIERGIRGQGVSGPHTVGLKSRSIDASGLNRSDNCRARSCVNCCNDTSSPCCRCSFDDDLVIRITCDQCSQWLESCGCGGDQSCGSRSGPDRFR